MVSGSQRYRIAIGPHQVVTISLPIRLYVHGRDSIYHLVIEPNAIQRAHDHFHRNGDNRVAWRWSILKLRAWPYLFLPWPPKRLRPCAGPPSMRTTPIGKGRAAL